MFNLDLNSYMVDMVYELVPGVKRKGDFEGIDDAAVKGLMKHAGVVKKKMEPER